MNRIGAPILLFFLWVVGLPLATYLSLYQHMGILGILIGMSIAMLAEIPVFIFIQSRRFDWDELARKAAMTGGHPDSEDAVGIVVIGAAVELSTGDIVASLQELNVFSSEQKEQEAEERHKKETQELTMQFTRRVDELQAQVVAQEDAIQQLTRQVGELLSNEKREIPVTAQHKPSKPNEEHDSHGGHALPETDPIKESNNVH